MRSGRESNPRIGVLQTPALPLGYQTFIGDINFVFTMHSIGEKLLWAVMESNHPPLLYQRSVLPLN